MCPESWLPGTSSHADLAASLRPALDLPVERVLVSHGEPVLHGGREALAAALEAPDGVTSTRPARFTNSIQLPAESGR
jgi:glyoxylase-like metal-dependent hydrolase (beta-lactamase superfamily II)